MPVTGGDVIRRRLRVIQRAVNETIVDGMDDFAKDVLRQSRDLAPQLTGLMIRTSDVDSDDNRALGTFRRSVFYEQVYAIWQHEEVFNPGPITSTKPGAGPKFLRRAYDFQRAIHVPRIGKRVGRALRLSLR